MQKRMNDCAVCNCNTVWVGGVPYVDGTVSAYRHLLFSGSRCMVYSFVFAILVCMRMRMYGISISMSNIIAHSIGYGQIENVIDAKALAS